MTEADVRALVVAARENEGVRGLARRLNVSPSYVSDVCCGRRAPGPPFCKAFGITRRRICVYEIDTAGTNPVT